MSRNFDRLLLQRMLLDESTRLYELHREELAAIGSRISVGGAHMDVFFQAVGLHGVLTGLREGRTIGESVALGCKESTDAVHKWNEKREYQVHRSDGTAHAFIERTVMKFLEKAETPF